MLYRKIKSLERLYRDADRHVSAFKRRTGLTCFSGCGECCQNGELNSTIIEFLPAAYNLFIRGQTDTILDLIENKADPVCVFFRPFSEAGNCSVYRNRGLICRLFGFSAMTDKRGIETLVTCPKIKKSLNVLHVQPFLDIAPRMSSYYLRMYGIDPALSVRYLPVNQAISEAIEQVLQYFDYRKKPA